MVPLLPGDSLWIARIRQFEDRGGQETFELIVVEAGAVDPEAVALKEAMCYREHDSTIESIKVVNVTDAMRLADSAVVDAVADAAEARAESRFYGAELPGVSHPA